MATSTYADTTTADSRTAWILDAIQTAHEYRSPATAPDAVQRRTHNIITRHRYLNGNIHYIPQKGQIGIGANLAGYLSGVAALAPSSSTDGYLCIDDRISNAAQGTGIATQAQTWEHFGSWEPFDETQLQ
jgi:hypothetical protein